MTKAKAKTVEHVSKVAAYKWQEHPTHDEFFDVKTKTVVVK